MEEIRNNLSSLSWWIGVVLVGIILNLFSGYLKNSLDALLSKVSKWWNNRSEKRKREREALLEVLRNDKQEQILLFNKLIARFLTGLLFSLFGIAFLGILVLLFLVMGEEASIISKLTGIITGFCFIYSTAIYGEAQNLYSLVVEAGKKQD